MQIFVMLLLFQIIGYAYTVTRPMKWLIDSRLLLACARSKYLVQHL